MRKSRREKQRYIACYGSNPLPYLKRSLGEFYFGMCGVKIAFSRGNLHLVRVYLPCYVVVRGLLSLTSQGERCYPLLSSGTLKSLKEKLRERNFI